MKKIILSLLLILSLSTIKAQTYKADTLVYYSSAYNPSPDTVLVEDITIVIDRGALTISKHNARFRAVITDTMPVKLTDVGITDRIFKLRSYPTMYKDDTGYVLLMIMSYWQGNLIALGLLHHEQLFIYHITNELINLNARKQTYIDDWIRAAFGK